MKKPKENNNPGAQGFCAINVPAELMGRLRKEAEEECRSPERQLEWLLKQHYYGLRAYSINVGYGTVANDSDNFIGGPYKGNTIGDAMVKTFTGAQDCDSTTCTWQRTVGNV